MLQERPNVQPNPDDYEVSVGISNDNFYLNRQWERELGEFYIDDLFWYKFDNILYFKPEYMNKESKNVKYLKIDSRRVLLVIGHLDLQVVMIMKMYSVKTFQHLYLLV